TLQKGYFISQECFKSHHPELEGVHNAQSEEMSNSSSISHFLLLPLADTRQLQLLHFCLFLAISLAALLANGLIISAVACGHHLHTPIVIVDPRFHKVPKCHGCPWFHVALLCHHGPLVP
ncbi:hypothetical protein IHE44_0002973, partial [Lamprotornis superbus]